MLHHEHNNFLVVLSILIAVLSSYIALDLANSLAYAKGRLRYAWLGGGALAMGVGIWSMHFVGMLAFSLQGIAISYDVPLLILSILVAILASCLTLHIVSKEKVSTNAFILGSLTMAAAIAGMHYIGIASMRLAANIHWDLTLVVVSILIALIASFVALLLAFRLRDDISTKGFIYRGAGGVLMGIAIAGMHYTAMMAMHFTPAEAHAFQQDQLLATDGLAVSVIIGTIIILGIALTGSIIDRALSRRTALAEQITKILESISDAFYSVDRQWHFTYINQVADETFRKLTGNTSSDLLGKSLWETLTFVKGTELEATLQKSMNEKTNARVEYFLKEHGLWLESQVYSSQEGLSVYFRDVTDRKRDEHALKEAIAARDEFLSIASHELKTPLTTLKLQTQLAQRNAVVKSESEAYSIERMKKFVDQTDKSVERLNRLVDDMLDISRLSTGKLTLHIESFELSELISEVVERLRPLMNESKCGLDLEIEPGITGEWDKFRIEQVVTNLLTNAARYGAGKSVQISLRKEKNVAIFSVKDRGRGIAPEDHDRIFRRFERAISVSEVSGMGLGLFIVREILQMHQGSIKVISELGQGAEFIVRLPFKKEG